MCKIFAILMLPLCLWSATATNIDCNGKPFHCVNSTHFMICVDVGGGVSKTVDDFAIQCPSKTVCLKSNYFECEYKLLTTTQSNIRLSEETNNFSRDAQVPTTLSNDIQKKSMASLHNEYYNTIDTTTYANDVLNTQTYKQYEISEFPLKFKDVKSSTFINGHLNILMATTKTYAEENLQSTSPKTNSQNDIDSRKLLISSTNPRLYPYGSILSDSTNLKQVDMEPSFTVNIASNILNNNASNSSITFTKSRDTSRDATTETAKKDGSFLKGQEEISKGILNEIDIFGALTIQITQTENSDMNNKTLPQNFTTTPDTLFYPRIKEDPYFSSTTSTIEDMKTGPLLNQVNQTNQEILTMNENTKNENNVKLESEFDISGQTVKRNDSNISSSYTFTLEPITTSTEQAADIKQTIIRTTTTGYNLNYNETSTMLNPTTLEYQINDIIPSQSINETNKTSMFDYKLTPEISTVVPVVNIMKKNIKTIINETILRSPSVSNINTLLPRADLTEVTSTIIPENSSFDKITSTVEYQTTISKLDLMDQTIQDSIVNASLSYEQNISKVPEDISTKSLNIVNSLGNTTWNLANDYLTTTTLPSHVSSTITFMDNMTNTKTDMMYQFSDNNNLTKEMMTSELNVVKQTMKLTIKENSNVIEDHKSPPQEKDIMQTIPVIPEYPYFYSTFSNSNNNRKSTIDLKEHMIQDEKMSTLPPQEQFMSELSFPTDISKIHAKTSHLSDSTDVLLLNDDFTTLSSLSTFEHTIIEQITDRQETINITAVSYNTVNKNDTFLQQYENPREISPEMPYYSTPNEYFTLNYDNSTPKADKKVAAGKVYNKNTYIAKPLNLIKENKYVKSQNHQEKIETTVRNYSSFNTKSVSYLNINESTSMGPQLMNIATANTIPDGLMKETRSLSSDLNSNTTPLLRDKRISEIDVINITTESPVTPKSNILGLNVVNVNSTREQMNLVEITTEKARTSRNINSNDKMLVTLQHKKRNETAHELMQKNGNKSYDGTNEGNYVQQITTASKTNGIPVSKYSVNVTAIQNHQAFNDTMTVTSQDQVIQNTESSLREMYYFPTTEAFVINDLIIASTSKPLITSLVSKVDEILSTHSPITTMNDGNIVTMAPTSDSHINLLHILHITNTRINIPNESSVSNKQPELVKIERPSYDTTFQIVKSNPDYIDKLTTNTKTQSIAEIALETTTRNVETGRSFYDTTFKIEKAKGDYNDKFKTNIKTRPITKIAVETTSRQTETERSYDTTFGIETSTADYVDKFTSNFETQPIAEIALETTSRLNETERSSYNTTFKNEKTTADFFDKFENNFTTQISTEIALETTTKKPETEKSLYDTTFKIDKSTANYNDKFTTNIKTQPIGEIALETITKKTENEQSSYDITLKIENSTAVYIDKFASNTKTQPITERVVETPTRRTETTRSSYDTTLKIEKSNADYIDKYTTNTKIQTITEIALESTTKMTDEIKLNSQNVIKGTYDLHLKISGVNNNLDVHNSTGSAANSSMCPNNISHTTDNYLELVPTKKPVVLPLLENIKQHSLDAKLSETVENSGRDLRSTHGNNYKLELVNPVRNKSVIAATNQAEIESRNIDVSTKYDKSTSGTTLFTCKNRFHGRFAAINNCTKYYICVGKIQPVIGECPTNTVFSEIKKQCTKKLSHCIRNHQFRCLKEGRFSDALKSNFYYICVNNNNGYVRFQFQCQNGFHLNKTSVRCVNDIKFQSQTISVSIDYDSNKESNQSTVERKSKEKNQSKERAKFTCKEAGTFPDAEDCRRYYVCSKNSKSVFRRRTKKCDSDEVFHREKKKCVDGDSYECI